MADRGQKIQRPGAPVTDPCKRLAFLHILISSVPTEVNLWFFLTEMSCKNASHTFTDRDSALNFFLPSIDPRLWTVHPGSDLPLRDHECRSASRRHLQAGWRWKPFERSPGRRKVIGMRKGTNRVYPAITNKTRQHLHEPGWAEDGVRNSALGE